MIKHDDPRYLRIKEDDTAAREKVRRYEAALLTALPILTRLPPGVRDANPEETMRANADWFVAEVERYEAEVMGPINDRWQKLLDEVRAEQTARAS